MSARTCNISAELDLPGVNVQVLDYRWNANERVSHLEERFILRYRPFPTEVSLSARLGSEVQDFGQLMFFPAQMETQTTPARASERTRNVMCSFTNDWLRRIWPDMPDWDRKLLGQCFNLQNSRVEQAMQKLAVEAASPGFASNLLAESIAQFIAVEVARQFNPRQYHGRIRTVEGQLSAKELSRIYDFVDSITNKCVTTDEIAQKCGISSAHLRRSFKRTTEPETDAATASLACSAGAMPSCIGTARGSAASDTAITWEWVQNLKSASVEMHRTSSRRMSSGDRS